jgi:membrane protease YdiL (CAAX protease family)
MTPANPARNIEGQDRAGGIGLRARVFALGRFGIFVGLVFALLKLAEHFTEKIQAATFYGDVIVGNARVLIVAMAATAVMAAIDKRGFGRNGLGDREFAKRFATGAVWGFVVLTLLLLVMRAAAVFHFGHVRTHGMGALGYAAAYAVMFFFVAISEETLFRGYALVSLTEAITFWPAVIVLAAIFAASHAHHGAESYAGLFFAGAYGAVLAYSFQRSGSLWLAIGIHTMWDYAQSFLYGVPDSGVIVPGSWLAPVIQGPKWLTGGLAGPEGSYLMVLVLAAMAIAIGKCYGPRRFPADWSTSL